MKNQILNGRLWTIALAIFSLVIVSCSGDDGEDGATGPAGNAKVRVDTFTVASTAWTGGSVKNYSMAASNITQSVVDGGMVMVYRMGVNDTTWSALPYSFNIGVNVGGQTAIARLFFQHNYDVGNLYMTVGNDANFNITTSATFPGTATYKLVTIPPASLIKDMDYEDYQTVSSVYGL